MKLLLLALAVMLAPAAQPRPLQRQAHDHTIYIVEGSAHQLARFQNEIGAGWKGGTLLKKDEKQGKSRYWAFAQRTAPQAREFMLASMMYQLKMDMEAYEESRSFPAIRAELDALAIKCGCTRDPFFITPLSEVRVSPEPGLSFEAIDCILSGIGASDALRALPTVFVGNGPIPEKAK